MGSPRDSIDIPSTAMASAILSHRHRTPSSDSEAGRRKSTSSGFSRDFKSGNAKVETVGDKGAAADESEGPSTSTITLDEKTSTDQTHRLLRPRHIQLIGIGGTIGTALFVAIGKGLMKGGPGSLFLAFAIWCVFIVAVTNTMAEMVTYNPISSPFIRFAGRYVDDAFGVAAGYNFFVFEAVLVPFEVVACVLIVKYWTDVIPDAALMAAVIALYGLINIFGVRAYGESEFWLAIGKVILIVGLLFYTLVTMLGGNPQGDRYGFRFWQDPGSFAEYYQTGTTGRFMGFLTCLCQAAFTVAGPDYVSMAAGEAQNPRVIMPKAFKAVAWRLSIFFVLGSLAVGINVPYTDPDLAEAYSTDASGAKASPYVISMNRLGIKVLPDIVNAMILVSAFSAGNSYVYCSSRSLYGLALERKAPKIFTKCTNQGVPIYCVLMVLTISLLAFLQVSNSGGVVLGWFINLVTASQLINYTVAGITFLAWMRACKAQGIDREKLSYRGRWQPYQAYFGLAGTGTMIFIGGYEVFLPGKWDVPTFLFSYSMVMLFPVVYFGWKFIKGTKILRPEEVVLRTHEVMDIEVYTENYVEGNHGKGERVLNLIFG